ncbi:MAG: MBL fold metallo-hydrolase [Ilumatobacteraceae bacterium]
MRGSTPCNGDDVARYGGNTSCVSVDAPGERPLLFDMGTGLRYYGLNWPKDEPFKGTCLVSHLHWDHVQGLPFFGPLLHEEAVLVVYAPAQHDGCGPAEVLKSCICPPLFPIGLDGFPGHVDVRCPPSRFSIGGYRVESAPVPHVGDTVGYRVTHGDVSVAYISDHQQPSGGLLIADRVRGLCTDVDLLIHDAQYTPAEFKQKRDWGHCTIEYAVWLAGEVGARRLALYHHDPSHDDDTIDCLTAAAAMCGRQAGVEVFAAREGLTVTL